MCSMINISFTLWLTSNMQIATRLEIPEETVVPSRAFHYSKIKSFEQLIELTMAARQMLR